MPTAHDIVKQAIVDVSAGALTGYDDGADEVLTALAEAGYIVERLDVDALTQIIRKVDAEQDAVMAGPDALAEAILAEIGGA